MLIIEEAIMGVASDIQMKMGEVQREWNGWVEKRRVRGLYVIADCGKRPNKPKIRWPFACS